MCTYTLNPVCHQRNNYDWTCFNYRFPHVHSILIRKKQGKQHVEKCKIPNRTEMSCKEMFCHSFWIISNCAALSCHVTGLSWLRQAAAVSLKKCQCHLVAKIGEICSRNQTCSLRLVQQSATVLVHLFTHQPAHMQSLIWRCRDTGRTKGSDEFFGTNPKDWSRLFSLLFFGPGVAKSTQCMHEVNKSRMKWEWRDSH